MSEWTYATTRPNPLNIDVAFMDTAEHRHGFRRRKDKATGASAGRIVTCSCGWRSDDWTSHSRLLEIAWYRHLDDVSEHDEQCEAEFIEGPMGYTLCGCNDRREANQ